MDIQEKRLLTGGRITQGVVRVGNTVRRPTGAYTPFVHSLLCHLEESGFEGAPRVLGIDEQGREVLTFIEGHVPPDLATWSDEQLVQAAELNRRFHDPTGGSVIAGQELDIHTQGRRIRMMCEAYGVREPFDAIGAIETSQRATLERSLRRLRSGGPKTTVAHARESVRWIRSEMAWLKSYRDVLEGAGR
jgi:hypothetical protein